MFIKFLFVSFVLCFQCPLSASDQSTVEIMRERIENLGKETSFTFVDLDLTDNDKALIDQLKINSTDQYNRFGQLDLLKEELPAFFRSIGNDDEKVIQALTNIILEATSHVKDACGKETAWVCIRASLPHPLCDVPRWHADGYYYSPFNGLAFKFAAALKGRQTLFYDLPEALREEFKQLNGSPENRTILNELLDKNLAISAPNGFGAFFIVGDQDCAAVHSEPPIDCERLFISILPGDKNEIEELYLNWHPK